MYKKAIDEAIIEAVANAKAAKVSYELPPEAEIGVTKWFGKPVVKPAFQNALQASFVPKDKTPPAPSRSPGSDSAAKESMTAAQKAMYPST